MKIKELKKIRYSFYRNAEERGTKPTHLYYAFLVGLIEGDG
jgi:hypothetical protein